jgi:O-antigen ligase
MLFALLAGDAVRYTLSWYGFAALHLVLLGIAVWLIARDESRPRIGNLPLTLLAFMGFSALSVAWSQYRAETLLATVIQIITALGAVAVAVTYSWDEILRHLGRALRYIVGLSLLFELVVTVFVRRPILPFWVDYGGVPIGDLPAVTYWSRNHLLDGERIQGVVGNASLLGWAAGLAVIVLVLQFAAGQLRPLKTGLWLAAAVLVLALTRSATVWAILVAVALVAVLILLLRRYERPAQRRTIGWSAVVVAVGGGAGVVAFNSALLSLVGKSEDLTGRVDIWAAVIGLAQQHPVLGWGWISYWAPWREPFADLVIRNGVVQLHAHNAWLDVWLQLGAIGLALFAALVVTTVGRSWLLAVDRRYGADRAPLPHVVVTLLPVLLLTALLVQSLAESRLLLEYGWFLVVLISAKTKLERYRTVATPAELRDAAPVRVR